MLSSSTFGWLRDGIGNEVAAREIESHLSGNVPGKHWFVDAKSGGSGNDGRSWSRAFGTMEAAFDVLDDNDVIHLRGPISETLTCPDGVTGVTVVGDGAGLRHGSTSNVAEGYAAAWHDDSEAPLVQVHSQGWTFANILFAPHSGDSAIEILSDGAADPEHTVSGLRIIGCRFAGGEYGLEDNGGSGFVSVIGNRFESCTIAGIANVSTANALPLQWDVIGNVFANGNAHHIDAPASKWTIKDNVFHTVASTAEYIDLTGGANNMVVGNYLGGVYNTSDYVAGTSDLWLGNWVTAISTQAPNGFTILAPAAP